MLWRISAANVSTISSGSRVHSFMTCRGAPAAKTVTADCPSRMPRCCASGIHELSCSSSAMQNVNFPGWPSVERSISPGITPSTLINTSRIARPMLALGRFPFARTLCVAFIPMSVRTGPLTTMNGAVPPVLAEVPWRLYFSSHIARRTATTTGM